MENIFEVAKQWYRELD